jgi:hypothetical protein
MSPLQPLYDCEGHWKGTNALQLSPDEPAETSNSFLTITPMLNGYFIRIEQSWSFRGIPHYGSLLVGFDDQSQQISLHWIDTFHMARKVMPCQGLVREDGIFDVLGSYSAPPDPDWGWRITIKCQPSHSLEIQMFNIDPHGKEILAVTANHTPA